MSLVMVILKDIYTSQERSECLLLLNLNLDLMEWIYIQSIAKNAGKMISSLYHFRKYLNPPVKNYLYKGQIKLKMESWCYI